MDIKPRLLRLQEVLDQHSIPAIWESDNCLLIKSNSSNGFDIKFEFSHFDVLLWFDEININVHPKEFGVLIPYIELAFSGKLGVRKASRKQKITKIELLSKEDESWETQILVNYKDWRFWIAEETRILENDYSINSVDLNHI